MDLRRELDPSVEGQLDSKESPVVMANVSLAGEEI